MVMINTGAAGVGTFTYPVRIYSSDRHRSNRFEPLVDTGSLFTWIPGTDLEGLGIRPEREIPFKTATGEVLTRRIAEAPIEIDGVTATTIVVFGAPSDLTLLGAYTLEGFLLMPDVVHKRLVPIIATVA